MLPEVNYHLQVSIRAIADGFVNFQSIALYDETYGYIMSAVVFMATIQFLKLLQFNQKMSMLGDTVQLAAKDLKVSDEPLCQGPQQHAKV